VIVFTFRERTLPDTGYKYFVFVFLFYIILCVGLVRGNFTVDIEWVVWRILILVVLSRIVLDNFVILILRLSRSIFTVLHMVFSFFIISQRAY